MDKLFIYIQDPLTYKMIHLEDFNQEYQLEGLNFYYERQWYLKLDNDLFFEDDAKIKALKVQMYLVKSSNCYYKRQILVFKESEGLFSFAFYQKKDFLISPFDYADLIYTNPYFAGKYLYYQNFKIKTNYPFVYLNHHLYQDEIIQEGDEIMVLGLKIIFLKDHLWLNHFYLNNKLFKELPSHFGKIPYFKAQKYEIPYRKKVKEVIFKNEVIDAPNYEKIPKLFELFEQLLPSLTISFAMVAVSILNAYLNYQRGRRFLELLPLLILPMVLLCSSLIWPILFYKLKKRRIQSTNKNLLKTYQQANQKAYETLRITYQKYLDLKYEEYFNLAFLKEAFLKKRFYYIHHEDADFLNISLGICLWEKDLSFIQDPILENKLQNEFKTIPLFLDLKEVSICSILEAPYEQYYFLKKILLELVLKYQAKDLMIVFYGIEDPYFEQVLNEHFFLDEVRLFYEKEEELQNLLPLVEKEIVIIGFKKLQYTQLKKNWHFLYYHFKDIHRLSDTIIELHNGFGYLRQKALVSSFNYDLEDFNTLKSLKQLSFFKTEKLQKSHYFGIKEAYHWNHLSQIKSFEKKKEGLSAVIARFEGGLFELNLEAEGHGPHGLIAGSTGSGKTELLVSILASFAISYSAYDVGFIIIDFKGGAIVERLTYKGQRIPHIYAEISNLNEDSKRFLIALQKECQKRQLLFQKLSQHIFKPIMDLKDYKKERIEGFENLAHLLIVVDEFAELKRQEPEFLKELISLSRIGRSLGIHLILSTQKPSGVIDDEIWANSRFKIALKVVDEKDSKEVIKTDKAAYLKKAGQFYCLIDQNIFFLEALYTRYPLNDQDYKIALLNKKWQKVKEYKEASKSESELDYVLAELIQEENPHYPFIFFKPKALSVPQLKKKYQVQADLILGEYDDYLNQKMDLVFLDLKNNPLLVVGMKAEHFIHQYQAHKQIIYIGLNVLDHPCSVDEFRLYEEDYEVLIEKLKKEKHLDHYCLIYEDLNQFFAYKELYIQIFLKLHQEYPNLNMIAFINSPHLLPARVLSLFKTKIYKGQNPNEYFSLYEAAMQMKGDYYINHGDEVLPYVSSISKKVYKRVFYKAYIPHIPSVILKKVSHKGILIGYDLKSREALYIDPLKDYVVTSFDEEALYKFKLLYHEDNFKIEVYSRLKKIYYPRLLFLKGGLFHQSLFIVKGQEDLSDQEAIYFEEGKQRRIRMVDYE